MYSATNALVKAMTYFPDGRVRKSTKIVIGRKNRHYVVDRDYYRNVYLKSPHWFELRARKLQSQPECETCGRTVFLDVHHKNYKSLYDVELSDLKTLCRRCHKEEHRRLASMPTDRQKIKQAKRAKRSRDIIRLGTICTAMELSGFLGVRKWLLDLRGDGNQVVE